MSLEPSLRKFMGPSHYPGARHPNTLPRKMTAIDPDLRIHSVRLAVSDLPRSVDFYERILGLPLLSNDDETAWLGADREHPALQLTRLQSPTPAPSSATGLFHVAWLHPSRQSLAATAVGTPAERPRREDVHAAAGRRGPAGAGARGAERRDARRERDRTRAPEGGRRGTGQRLLPRCPGLRGAGPASLRGLSLGRRLSPPRGPQLLAEPRRLADPRQRAGPAARRLRASEPGGLGGARAKAAGLARARRRRERGRREHLRARSRRPAARVRRRLTAPAVPAGRSRRSQAL